MKIKELSIVDSFPNDNQPDPVKYYFDGTHIDNWQYSPKNAEKIYSPYFKNLLKICCNMQKYVIKYA